jgi:molybdopterin-binding protein
LAALLFALNRDRVVFETRRVRHGVTSNQPLRFSRQANKGVKMKLSARNQFRGKIVDVKKGSTTSHVRIDIGQGVIVTSSITNAAVADLDLRIGDDAWAVIKASDVMIGK